MTHIEEESEDEKLNHVRAEEEEDEPPPGHVLRASAHTRITIIITIIRWGGSSEGRTEGNQGSLLGTTPLRHPHSTDAPPLIPV